MDPVPSLLGAAAIIGALGISPFAALALFGLAHALELYQLPAGIAVFGQPVAIFLSGAAALVLHSGRSSKLSKPFAEVAGVAESAVALIVTLALAVPLIASGPVSGLVFMLAAVGAVAAVVTLRTALDVFVWLTPLPFVDGLFQAFKLGVLGLLLTAALVSAPVAVGLNALLLGGAFVLTRWTARTLRFGGSILYDLTLGSGDPERTALPRDEVVDGDLGPFDAFALRAPGLRRRDRATLELRVGRWFLVGAGPGGPAGSKDTPLGDGDTALLTPTWAGLELAVGDAVFLLPPRYRQHADQIRAESKANLGKKPGPLPRRAQKARRAEPSLL